MELEGVRGLAAIAVVMSHYVLAFYPALVSGNASLAHTRFEDNIHGTPLALAYAGTFAVAIFFVLSGFVLSIGYFQTRDEAIVRKLAMGRYLRLMLPALASVILAYVLIAVGSGQMAASAGAATGSWYLNSWVMDADLFAALKSGVLDIFVQGGSPYNSVLWTMKIEFLGSFLVFVFLLLFAKSRYRWVMYAGLAIATFNTWFLPFVLGVIIADAYAHGWLEKLRRVYIILPLLVGGLLLGSVPHRGSEGTMYEALMKFDLASLIGVDKVNLEILYLTIGATMLILAILLSKRLSAWFRHPKIAILGKYTFALYLTHALVLLSFSSAVFVALHESLGYNKTVALVLLLSVPVIWITTILFERYVDAPSIKFAKWASTVYRGERKIGLRSRVAFAKDRIRPWAEKYIGWSSRPELNREAD